MADLGPGSTFGPYRIESLLGRGGMSVVYLAEDTRLARHVAIKVLAPELAADEAFRSRFVRESQLAAGLDHPNIVPVFEAGETDGQLFIAMRYVRGTDLRTLIVREGPLDADRTIALLRPVASALDTAHRQGLVHRDVKPANILIAADQSEEHVYLSDFGLTKRASSRSGLTRTGQFMGTVDYVAPEQIQGEEVDGRTDEYSLACVLYECLTGNVPFAKDSDVATLFGHIQDPPPKVTPSRDDLSEEVDDVIATAMAKDRDQRFATCGAMLDAAARAVGAPTGPREAPSVPPSPPPFGTAPDVTPPAPMPAPVAMGAPSAPPIPDASSGPSSFPPTSGPSSPPASPEPYVPPLTSGPGSTPPVGGNRRVVALFAAGGAAIAALVIVIGIVLSGGGDEPGPGPGTGPTDPPSASPTPPPPLAVANGEAIKIGDSGEATPYPSAIDVSSDGGSVTDVNVTLAGFGHSFPDDVSVLLVGPEGQSVVLMSDVGGGSANGVAGLDLVLDDEATRGLTDKGTLRSGTFRPTAGTDKGGGVCCGFTGASPAPSPPYGDALSVFAGSDPNGEWDLYVYDDSGGDQGRITGGWSMMIELGEATSPGPATGTTGTTGTTGATGTTDTSGPTGSAAVFSDGFSDPGSGWDVFQDARSSGGYENGTYVLSVDGGFRVTGDFNSSSQELSTLGDVRIEATGQLLTAPNAVYGLVCRASSPTSYYYFLIQGNGSYYIGENEGDTVENFDTGFSPSITTGKAPNRIAAECVDGPGGVQLRLFVNGIAVNTVVDAQDPLVAGSTGFRVESRSTAMSAAFDDYIVSVPAGS